ncbi:hypothetical protein P1P91_00010 [Halomonas piscis]|uniref:Uncharacterized protein n=1 Tax=Halomonas piscis TaxID=3031727 RepID=A0ABY9Z0A1_9GAMM|nr:hypothetical protein [Halomonas piscis]WNK20120.1 hypothetical protein P1P91_00010 [Halomonas piscis]
MTGPQFKDFLEFNKRFCDKYAKQMEKYPYAFMLVEKELRNIESGREWLAYANFKKLSRYKPLKNFYRSYAFLVARFLSKNTLKTYVSLGRFKSLEERVKQHYGLRDESKVSKLKYPFMLIKGDAIRLSSLPVARCGYSSFYKRLLRSDFDSLSEKYLDKINRLAKNDVLKLSDLMKRLGVKRIIATGDSTSASRLLCEAAKKAGAKYFVVAHGYVQDPKLISIAPIYADRIFMWTHNQQASFQEAVQEESQKSKIFFEGSPLRVKDNQVQEELEERKFLFALEPLPKDEDQKKSFIDIVRSYARKVIECGAEPVFRLHPKDNKESESFLSLVGCGKLSSVRDVYYDIGTSRCVVISNSSVAVQSALYGVKSVQIKGLKKFDFEYTEAMSLAEFDRFIKNGMAGAGSPLIEPLSPEVFD